MELVPLFIGSVFFIICLIFGIAYSCFIAKGRKRWWGLLIVVVGTIGIFPLLAIMPPISMSVSSLSGRYEGYFGGGNNIMILYPNGVFNQTFVDGQGKTYNNYGKWSLDSDSRSIDFDHLLITVNGFGQPQSPQIGSFYGAGVRAIDGSIRFNDDADIYLKRT